ncbi:transposase family protein [Nocardiopsis quinghaiensis]|uniref:transposase family protein n=1 Tax=Nocardiopsis quinghaiensis TaxID=464995 RepID=UPI001CC26DB9
MRHDLPHAVLGLLFGVGRSTVTRAVGQVRALSAERGRAAPRGSGRASAHLGGRLSPTPRPRMWSCGWTPPRSRCAGPSGSEQAAGVRLGQEEADSQGSCQPGTVTERERFRPPGPDSRLAPSRRAVRRAASPRAR